MHFVTNPNCGAEMFKALFHRAFAASESDEEGNLIGHLAFESATNREIQRHAIVDNQEHICASAFTSPLYNDRGIHALLMAPVAVDPDYQKQGLTRQLIESIIQEARDKGCDILITSSDPAPYGRFGFHVVASISWDLHTHFNFQRFGKRSCSPVVDLFRQLSICEAFR